MKRLFQLTLALSALVLSAAAAEAKTVYVRDLDGLNTGNGLTWATAKGSIQGGIGVAAPGDLILVEAGVYHETPIVGAGLTLQGGVGGASVIDGSQAIGNPAAVVTLPAGPGTVTLDTFVVRNGKRGIFGNNTSVVIWNCQVINNSGIAGFGSVGIQLEGCPNVTLSDSLISGNVKTGDYGSGAVRIVNSQSITLTRNTIENNVSIIGDSGIALGEFDSLVSSDNVVRNNTGTAMAVICGFGNAVRRGSARFTRDRILNNRGEVWVGGLLIDSVQSAIVEGCEISDNVVSGNNFTIGGSMIRRSGSIQVKDCVFARNESSYMGALDCRGTDVTITGCTLENNRTRATNVQAGGSAGLNVSDVTNSVVVSNNTFSGNSGAGPGQNGAAVLNHTGLATFNYNRVLNNSGAGAVIQRFNGPMDALNNEFRGNTSVDSCALATGAGVVANNLFVGNTGPYVGALFVSNTLVANNTLVGNGLRAILVANGGTATISNNIVSGHTIRSMEKFGTLGSAAVSYNCFHNSPAHTNSNMTLGPGNFTADPGFSNAAAGNYQLGNRSLCIDAGDNAVVNGAWQDLDGSARIQSARVDCGAYESSYTRDLVAPMTGAGVSPVSNAAAWINSNATVTLSASDGDGWGVQNITYRLSGATSKPNTVVEGSIAFVPLSNDGLTTVTFFATDLANNVEAAHIINIRIDKTAPTATSKMVSTDEDSPVGVTLTGADATSGVAGYSVISGPAHGALSGTAPNLTYTPAPDFSGTDSFTFGVVDAADNVSTPAVVTITIRPINEPPTASPQAVSTDEDVAVAVTLSGSDPDGDALSYSVVSGPAHGTLSGTAPNLTYTPAANYHGPDQLTFRVSDGTATSEAVVTVTVKPVNDPPMASPQAVETDEDTPIGVTLAGADPDGDTLSYMVVAGPQHGTLSGTAPNLTYTPAANYFGPDAFTFRVSDGEATRDAAVTLAVKPVNDAPAAAPQVVETDEDTAVSVQLGGTDVDGDALAYSVVSGTAHGTLTGTAPNLTYTPATGYSGADSFTFRVADGVATSEAVVTLIIKPVNDPPTATPQAVSTDEDVAVALILSGSDPDGDALSYSVVSGPAHGTLSGTAPNLTYTPAANYHGPDTFTFRVSDGQATHDAVVTLIVEPVNDAPDAVNDSVVGDLNQDVAIRVLENDVDVDGDPLRVTAFSQGAHGLVTLNADGVLSYAPRNGFKGKDTFTYSVADGQGGVDTATVTVRITTPQHAPIALADTATTGAGVPVTLDVLANDHDPNEDPLTLTGFTQPANGSVVRNANGTLTYTPAPGFTGTVQFTYTVSDGRGGAADGRVTVTVRQ